MLTTESTAQPDDLLEQLPEEARVLLAGRLRPDAPGAAAEFREDTLRSLRGMGYAVTEDSHGSRISATPRSGSPASPLSPLDVVRIAAEQEGGVQPRTKLPVCPKCQAASPLGSTKCQWCGEPLPTAQVP